MIHETSGEKEAKKDGKFEVHSQNVSHAVIEIFGGDNNLSDFAIEDLQEMAVGIGGEMAVLALADFIDSGAYVIEISPVTGPQVLESWGEIDTGDPRVLSEFLTRALQTYSPATRKAIGFWDHGSGIFEESDPTETILARRLTSVPRYRRSRSIPARRLFIRRGVFAGNPRARGMLGDDTNGGILTNREATGVLEDAFQRSKHDGPVDMIFSDTCLNGMLEVLEQLKKYARVVVGSEDLEPGDGWDYEKWFRMMGEQPPANAEEWAHQAVQAYGDSYKYLYDDHPCTQGAFRSDQKISEAFKELIETCDKIGTEAFEWLMKARAYSQAFAHRDTYDIRDFAEKLKTVTSNIDVTANADSMIKVFDEARVHSVALGDTVQQAHGLAFWFPSGKWAYNEVAETYRELIFNKFTGWETYLKKNYNSLPA